MDRTIRVGSKYKEAFDRVFELAGSGCIMDTTVSGSGDKRKIKYKDLTFEYNDSGKEQSEAEAKMTESGASWFYGLRTNTKEEDDASVWLSYIDLVAEQYHRENSLLEFKQNEDRHVSDKQAEQEKKYIEKVFCTLYPDYEGQVTILRGDERDRIQDIYCISFRMQVCDNGEAKPVLAKIYFRFEEGRMIPMRREEASGVNEHLCSKGAVQESGKTESSRTGGVVDDSSDIIDKALGALDALASGEGFDRVSFTECLVFSDDKDESVIKNFVSNGHVGTIILTCKTVKVLYVAHVRWMSSLYKIYAEGKELMRVQLGLDGGLTMTCSNCGEIVMEANSVKIYNEYGEARNCLVYPKEENLGLSDIELDEICEHGEISRHLKRLSCREAVTRGGCMRVVCDKQLMELEDADGNKMLKCRDCPFPEVLFVGQDGVKRYTRLLGFARDLMTLVPKTDIGTCSCCGRTFTRESLEKNDGRCEFCSSAMMNSVYAPEGGSVPARKLYGKYAKMLPISLRLRHLFDKKYCFEEADILLFVLKSDVYVFDKLALEDKGYIPSPRKIN